MENVLLRHNQTDSRRLLGEGWVVDKINDEGKKLETKLAVKTNPVLRQPKMLAVESQHCQFVSSFSFLFSAFLKAYASD